MGQPGAAAWFWLDLRLQLLACCTTRFILWQEGNRQLASLHWHAWTRLWIHLWIDRRRDSPGEVLEEPPPAFSPFPSKSLPAATPPEAPENNYKNDMINTFSKLENRWHTSNSSILSGNTTDEVSKAEFVHWMGVSVALITGDAEIKVIAYRAVISGFD